MTAPPLSAFENSNQMLVGRDERVRREGLVGGCKPHRTPERLPVRPVRPSHETPMALPHGALEVVHLEIRVGPDGRVQVDVISLAAPLPSGPLAAAPPVSQVHIPVRGVVVESPGLDAGESESTSSYTSIHFSCRNPT